MYFEFIGETSRVVVFTIDTEDNDDIKEIRTPCNIVVSPLGTAELIVHNDDGTRIVFDAVTGMLPNYTMVVAIKDSDGAFPDGESHDIRIVFDPFTPQDAPRVDRFKVVLVTDPCPLCGRGVANGEHDIATQGVDVRYDDSDDNDEDMDQEIKPFNRLNFHFDNGEN